MVDPEYSHPGSSRQRDKHEGIVGRRSVPAGTVVLYPFQRPRWRAPWLMGWLRGSGGIYSPCWSVVGGPGLASGRARSITTTSIHDGSAVAERRQVAQLNRSWASGSLGSPPLALFFSAFSTLFWARPCRSTAAPPGGYKKSFVPLTHDALLPLSLLLSSFVPSRLCRSCPGPVSSCFPSL